ncbi:hypothetical protein XENOCAPTIV_013062 [Xenoophorus captivus]|uniref:Uncharacterized protein n=1 Tax=Xenoophorus captivus TaxID=1517983 RepID=A0ABV0QI03_9TELE
MEELDHVPETSFEKDVVCEDEDSFCLSRDNITSLKLLLCQARGFYSIVLYIGLPTAELLYLKLIKDQLVLGRRNRCKIKTFLEFLELLLFSMLILQLEERKVENEATCESHREKIQQLWNRLQVPQEERELFNEHMVASRRRNLEAVR